MWVIALCWTISLLGLGSAEKAARVITGKTDSDVVLNCDILDYHKSFAVIGWNLNNSKTSIFAKFKSRSRWSINNRRFTGRVHFLNNSAVLISHLTPGDAGIWQCTTLTFPSGKNRYGTPIKLIVEVVPQFTVVPPAVKTVRGVGDDINLECSAVSYFSRQTVKVTWMRVGESLPPGRTTLNGGNLTITNIQRSDDGQYMCLAFDKERIAEHSTTITILATPGAPNITSIIVSGASVTITWMPGLDVGFSQKFEVWYRKSTDTDYQWKRTNLLPPGSNSYKLNNTGSSYLFAVRGVNSEGAGAFSLIIQGTTGNSPTYLPDKPLPPTNVIVNITSDGYYVSWNHEEVPGRPVVSKFVVEYRENNTFNAWIRVEESVDGDKRVHLLKSSFFEPAVVYEFRVYAFGKNLSEPAYASKTYVIVVPRFTLVPPAVKTVRLGDDINLECSAVSNKSQTVNVTWMRVGESLPPGRTTLNGGKLTIANIRRSDGGQYMCIASAKDGVAKHSTTITVLATPEDPNITIRVESGGPSVTIAWMPGLKFKFNFISLQITLYIIYILTK